MSNVQESKVNPDRDARETVDFGAFGLWTILRPMPIRFIDNLASAGSTLVSEGESPGGMAGAAPSETRVLPAFLMGLASNRIGMLRPLCLRGSTAEFGIKV